MESSGTDPLPDPAIRAALAAVAAAPAPDSGPDPTDQAIRLAVGGVREDAMEPLRAHVARLRAAYAAELCDRAAVPARVAALCAELEVRGLDGFVVPHADEHLGEYIPLRSRRLAWITGFQGSAGTAAILSEAAVILVDGRYTLQVRDQVDESLFQVRHVPQEPLADWIAERLPSGGKLGVDPWQWTAKRLEALAKPCARAGGSLVHVDSNPIDAVWTAQPPPPLAPVVPQPLEYAGEAHGAKRARLGAALADEGMDAAILTAPESVAWLLNVRGADVPNTPLALSFAILAADGAVDWFVDGRKLDASIGAHLDEGVRIRPPAEFLAALDDLGGRGVRVDPDASPARVLDRLAAAGATVSHGRDPCEIPKACKNDAELAGMRAAHTRDGVALTRFLAWLDREAPAGRVDELGAERRLAELRAEGEHYRGPSFDTISGSGPNGAVVHYRATPETNRRLGPGELYLVDSGGQYLDGTTDVTRTVAVGEPTDEMRARFTRVLKGHIAIAAARFPEGTAGGQLDTLARISLWEAGLDFDHGTGHGVGAYLGVHEGPQAISPRGGGVKLQPSMIVSNEPGYYRAGAYGIRIENLVAVVEAGVPDGGERTLLGFETLTLAPIDLRLVDPRLLTAGERAWLDAYHARVRETLSPLVDDSARRWLAAATALIADAPSAAHPPTLL